MADIDKLEAIAELTAAKARYCRFLDTKDWQGFGNLMTEDFEMDLSGTSDLGIIKGKEEALKQIRSSIETAFTAHQVHNPEIDIQGDEARVIWAMNDRIVWSSDRPSIVGYGHYHERWVRQGDEWKLAAQRLTRLHIDMLPPTNKV